MVDNRNELSRCAIGIDIGGTKMAVAVIGETGAILARSVLPTEAERGFGWAVDRLSSSVERLMATTGQGLLAAIGIGCAGPVDPRRGLINNPYTLAGWDHCDIVSPLSERFGVGTWIENDADAAAFGECACGAGQGVDPVVMLTFGTGIGGAAIVGGQIYRGVQGEHPEVGHIPISDSGPPCYCGLHGCLEALASGTAIGAAGQASGFEDARAVFRAAADGNTVARSIIDRAVGAAATAAWTICHTFLPQRLVLGGGMIHDHFELFAQAMRERLQPATQFTRSAVSIAAARLGNDAGVVGAASLALQRSAPHRPAQP
jgi:glucokinase